MGDIIGGIKLPDQVTHSLYLVLGPSDHREDIDYIFMGIGMEITVQLPWVKASQRRSFLLREKETPRAVFERLYPMEL